MLDNTIIEGILKNKYQPRPGGEIDFGVMTAKASHQWLFGMQDNEEGWTYSPNTTADFISKDGYLNIYFNSNADAYILSPEQLEIDGTTYNHILIRLKFEPGTYTNHTFSINWVLDADEEFNTSISVSVDTTGQEDGEFYEYDIDLSADNNWLYNSIHQIRFDFDDRSEKNIYIDYIRVQSSSESVGDKSVQLLQTDGSMPTIFRDHSDNVWAAWLKAVTDVAATSKTWTTDADFNTGTKYQTVFGSNKVVLDQTAPSDTLDQSQTSWDASGYLQMRYSTAIEWNANSFTPSVTANISKVILRLAKIGVPTGNIWITIETDNSNKPSGTIVVQSANVDVSGLSTDTVNGAEVTFTLSPTSLTSGIKYWIKYNGDYAESSSNHTIIFKKTSMGAHFGYYGNGSFHIPYDSNSDAYFKEYYLPSSNPYFSNGYIEFIYDAGAIADWSTYDFSVDLLEPANTNIKIKCATSNDNVSYSAWSGWFDTSTGNLTGVANSRYIKVQVYLETTNTATTPTLGALTINILTVPTYAIKYKKYTSGSWGTETTLVTDTEEFANNLCLYENNSNQMELVYALDSNVYRTYYNSGWQTPVSIVTHTSGDMRCWAFKGADGYDYIYYSYVSGGVYYIKFKSSADNYAAENSVLSSTSKIKNICVYEDDKNVVWLVYELYITYTLKPTFVHLYCKKSIDYGVTWGSATKISSTEETKEDLWLCGLDKLVALDDENSWETVVNSASPYKGEMYHGKVYMVDSFKSRLDGIVASDFNNLYKFDGADFSTEHDFSADTPAEKANDIIIADDYIWILGAAYVQKYDGTALTKLNTDVIDCANESYTFGEIGLCFGGLPIYCGGGKVGANDGKYYKFIDYVGWEGLIGVANAGYQIMESYYYEGEQYAVLLLKQAVWGEYWSFVIGKFNNSTSAFPFDIIYNDYSSTGYKYGGVSNYFVTCKMRFLNGVPYLLMVGGDSSGAVIDSRVYNLIDYSVSESLVGSTLNNFIRTVYDWKGEKYYITKQTTWKIFKYDEAASTWEENETAPCQAIDSIKTKVPLQHSYPRILQTNDGQILVYYQNNRNYYREPGKIQGILIERDSSLNVGDTREVSFVNRKVNLGFDVDDWTDTEKVSIFSTYNSVTDKYDVRYQVLEKIDLDSSWSSHLKVRDKIKGMTIELTDESQAGTFNIELDNSDDNFSPDNPDSSVYGYLEENKEVRLSLGFMDNIQLLMTGLIDEVNCDYTPDGAKVTKITGKDYWKKLLDVPVTLTVGEDKKVASKNSDILIKHIEGNTATDATRTISVITGGTTIYQLAIPVTFIVPQYDTITNYEIKLENISPAYAAGDYEWSWEHEGIVDKLSPGYFVKVKMITVNYNAPRLTFDLVGTSRTDSSTKTFGTFNANYDDSNVTLIETGVTNGDNCTWNDGIAYYIWDVLINIPSKEIDDDYDLTVANVTHNLPVHTPEYLNCEVVYPEYIEKASIHNKVVKTNIYILTDNASDFDFSFDLRVVYSNDNTQTVQVRPTKEELFDKLCTEAKITNSEFSEPIRAKLPKVSFIEENAIDCFEKLRQVCWDSNNKLYKLYFNNCGKLILKPIFEDYVYYSKLWTTDDDWMTYSFLQNVFINAGSVVLSLTGTNYSNYGANVLPENDGWTKYTNSVIVPTALGGVYHWAKVGTDYMCYYRHAAFVNSVGWTIEAKLKVVHSAGTSGWLRQIFISSVSDTRSCVLVFGEDRIQLWSNLQDLEGGNTLYGQYVMDTTHDYHIYRLVSKNNQCDVYVNDMTIPVISVTLTSLYTPSPSDSIEWGDHATAGGADSCEYYLDYLTYNDGIIPTYNTNGYIRLQKDAGEEVHWENYLISKSIPTGTGVRLRVKTASSQSELSTAGWSNWNEAANDDLDIPSNRWLEVELYLYTNDTDVTPVVDDLTINYRSITVQRKMVWTFTEYQDIIQLSKPLRDIELVSRVKVTGAEEEVREVVYPEKQLYTAHELTVGNHGDVDEYRLYFSNDNGAIKVDPSSIRVTEDSSSDATWIMESVSSDNVEIWVYNTNWWHTGWVKLNVYAKPVGDAVPTAIYKVETDVSSKRLYGLKQEEISNPLIATEAEAGYLALATLEESKLEKNTVEFETISGLLIEPGDFITVIHTDSNTNDCYRIRKVTHELTVTDAGNKLTTKLTALKLT